MGATATEAKPKLVNARTAAAIVGYSVYTLRRLAASGALPAVRLGPHGHLRFRVDDLEDFVSSGHPDTGAVEPQAAAGASTRRPTPTSSGADAPASEAG